MPPLLLLQKQPTSLYDIFSSSAVLDIFVSLQISKYVPDILFNKIIQKHRDTIKFVYVNEYLASVVLTIMNVFKIEYY